MEISSIGAVAAMTAAGLVLAAPAGADDGDFDRQMTAARSGGSCGALQHDPLVARVALIANRSTADYLNHNAEYVPVVDPLVVLNDFGSTAGRAVALQGHGPDDATAIRAALLQGYTAIPDCSYTTFGTSVIRDPGSGKSMVVAVLAGP